MLEQSHHLDDSNQAKEEGWEWMHVTPICRLALARRCWRAGSYLSSSKPMTLRDTRNLFCWRLRPACGWSIVRIKHIQRHNNRGSETIRGQHLHVYVSCFSKHHQPCSCYGEIGIEALRSALTSDSCDRGSVSGLDLP